MSRLIYGPLTPTERQAGLDKFDQLLEDCCYFNVPAEDQTLVDIVNYRNSIVTSNTTGPLTIEKMFQLFNINLSPFILTNAKQCAASLQRLLTQLPVDHPSYNETVQELEQAKCQVATLKSIVAKRVVAKT